MKTLWTKRPEDVLDYDVDFGRRNWLLDGDAISIATVTVSGGTVALHSWDFSASVVKVWLGGGADGDTAHVTVTVTTALGRTKTICFRVRIKEGC